MSKKHKEIEKREFFVKAKIEVRELEGGKSEFVGFIPYNSRSEFMGFFEVVKPGCFTKTIQESDIRCLFAHDIHKVLGRSKSGTLKFEDAEEGLKFYCPVSERSYSRDLVDLIASGDVDGISFGFSCIKDNWFADEFGNETRELVEVKLIEVSLGVTFPAYSESMASTRELEDDKKINFGKLYKIFIEKSKSTDEKRTIYSDGEKREFEKVISFFTELLTDEEREDVGADENHSDGNDSKPSETLTLMRRKLDLL